MRCKPRRDDMRPTLCALLVVAAVSSASAASACPIDLAPCEDAHAGRMILAAAPAEEAGLSEVAAAQPADLPEELGFPDPEDVMGRMAVHQTPEWLTVAD